MSSGDLTDESISINQDDLKEILDEEEVKQPKVALHYVNHKAGMALDKSTIDEIQ